MHLRPKRKPCCLKDRHGTGLVLVLGTVVGIIVFYSYAFARPSLVKFKKTKRPKGPQTKNDWAI